MGQIFHRAKKYLDQIDNVGSFVEIGTSRNGDDGSTRIISEWAKEFNQNLCTVDVDPINCQFVRDLGIPNIMVFTELGENFLKRFAKYLTPISFLYLDNFDWNWHPENTELFVLEQQHRYQELGLEMTNINSQRAHLEQMILALPAMAKQSIVVLDDTFYNKGWGDFSGKGGAVVPYLLSQGYTILETEEYPVYGTIMGRNINAV